MNMNMVKKLAKINKSQKLKPWQILLISIIALPTIIIGAFSENNEEKVLTEDINNEIFNEVKLEKMLQEFVMVLI